jgi:hypothetical protein
METGIASVSGRKGLSIDPHKFRPLSGRKTHATEKAGVPP